jgi:hypothetical protein
MVAITERFEIAAIEPSSLLESQSTQIPSAEIQFTALICREQ